MFGWLRGRLLASSPLFLLFTSPKSLQPLVNTIRSWDSHPALLWVLLLKCFIKRQCFLGRTLINYKRAYGSKCFVTLSKHKVTEASWVWYYYLTLCSVIQFVTLRHIGSGKGHLNRCSWFWIEKSVFFVPQNEKWIRRTFLIITYLQ